MMMMDLRVKNSRSLHRTFNVEPLYLQHENTGLAIDYMVSIVIMMTTMMIMIIMSMVALPSA